MRISDALNQLFRRSPAQKRTTSVQATPLACVDSVFKALGALVLSPDAAKEQFLDYDKAKKLSESEREDAIIRSYVSCERFIVKEKPPVVKEQYTVESLRQEIVKNVNIRQLGPYFQLFFLPAQAQAVSLYWLAIAGIIRYCVQTLGDQKIRVFIQEVTRGTKLDGLIVVSAEGMRMSQEHLAEMKSLPVTESTRIFGQLYQTIYSYISDQIGVDQTNAVFHSSYDLFKSIYPYDLLSLLLDVLPRHAFEDERLNVLSHSDLERISDKRTDSLTQEKSTLQKKVSEIEAKNKEAESTKKAMLNLLEDAREAEERERKGKEDLQKALDQIAKFAAVAEQERNTYLLLLSSIGEGVFVLNMERKVTIMNAAAEATLGYAVSEVVGKRFDELFRYVYKDNTPLEAKFWDEAFVSARSVLLPSGISVIGKSGRPVPVTQVISPIVDSKSNERKGVIVTFRDVREERALEDARINFISIASHQLRTPLTSMRWFGEMLMTGDAGTLSEEQKHFVERIYQGTDRMISLVNLLLQIARVEAGRVKIEPIPVDFKNTIAGVQLILKTNLETKHQSIDVKSDPDPFPAIAMDQEVIWQVFQNLISNASRYSTQDATIFVSLTKKDDATALCTIKDNGIGIPKDQQRRVFEKFFRAENALKAVPEGSGLGLSLVKLLVEGWGGKIWFESEEGKGTTFFFTIPFSGMKAKEGEVKLAV